MKTIFIQFPRWLQFWNTVTGLAFPTFVTRLIKTNELVEVRVNKNDAHIMPRYISESTKQNAALPKRVMNSQVCYLQRKLSWTIHYILVGTPIYCHLSLCPNGTIMQLILCGLIYVGRTEGQPNSRLNGHKFEVNNGCNQIFYQPDPSFFSMKVGILKKCTN